MSTLTKQSVILGVDDVKISEITQDTSSDLTHASSLDVPGIQRINLSPNFTEKGLKGDGKILDYFIELDTIGFSFDNAKVDLDVLAILEGGTIDTETDGTDQIKHTYTVSTDSTPKYFELEGKTNYTGGAAGDFHFTLFKCRANSVVVEHKTQDYAIVSVTGIAIPRTNDGKIKEYVINKTAQTIA
ncbi:MAG: hypothetical protein LBK53_09215 [Heliobacteriaceae bacterium]|jgi:hypothetical protein|nr:hypothetical protein [Heliobacteriaceae bacterium]